MLSESALLYIFSIIAEREETEEEKNVGFGIAAQIRKYIELNYQDAELSLEKISAHFGYNKNYIANAFKKAANISVGKYIMLSLIHISNLYTMARTTGEMTVGKNSMTRNTLLKGIRL